MTAITKFKAYDGTEFDDENRCEIYEANCRIADRIVGQLAPDPKDNDCKFANGGGYIQQDPSTVRKVRRELLEQAEREFSHKWFKQSIDDDTVHPSWAGRIISECCTERLCRAWSRISCIDNQFREWGQQYYRDHPQEAQNKRLNP